MLYGTNCPVCGGYAENVTSYSDKRYNYACRFCETVFYGDPIEGEPHGLHVLVDKVRGVVDLQNTSDKIIDVRTADLHRAIDVEHPAPEFEVIRVAPGRRLMIWRESAAARYS